MAMNLESMKAVIEPESRHIAEIMVEAIMAMPADRRAEAAEILLKGFAEGQRNFWLKAVTR